MGYRWIQPPCAELPENYQALTGSKFVKQFKTSEGDFDVLLIQQQNDLTKLPQVYVLERPPKFEKVALPHIRGTGFLCFADNDQAEWNPLDGGSFAKAIDKKISDTLNLTIHNYGRTEEYLNEFSNYWEGELRAYTFEPLPTAHKTIAYTTFLVDNGRSSKRQSEFLFYRDEGDRKRWLEVRNQKSTREDGTVIVISINSNNWTPLSVWPPSSFTEVLQWLEKVDHNARNNLIFRVLSLAARQAVVVLQIHGEGQLAFYVVFSDIFFRKLKSLVKRTKRKIKPLVSFFESPKSVRYFLRIQVEAIDRDTLFLRNRPRPDVGDLRDKKIAVIGCGTIGGYVADLLAKAGAGSGEKGSLTLFDGDSLSPGNLSRHRLPARFLGWNKADGLAELIKEDSLHRIFVDVRMEDFEVNSDNIRKYDIVIDAAGRVPLSFALAGSVREILKNRPLLIHGFNFLWGQESVVFVDDGKACYGCLGKFNNTPINMPNYDTTRFSCGSTYTPYDSSVSVVTAGLLQEAVLNTLEPKVEWTYARVTNDKGRLQKRLKIKPWRDCKVCNCGKSL